MTIRLAVFDCDGTIVDSQHSIRACMAAAFGAVGLTPPLLADVRKVVGLPLDQAIALLAGDDAAPIAEMSAAYSEAWTQARGDGSLDEPLFEGIGAVFDALERAGWVLGVATGKSSRGLTSTLDRHGLGRRFVTLQTADVARGKPDPDMLLRAMADAGVPAAATVMIGDTSYDMQMARAADVRALGVAWGYHAPDTLLKAGAAGIAENMRDLIELCEMTKENA